MVKSYLDKYFNRLNKESFEQRGMEWYIVPNHYWLELRIISAKGNTSQNLGSKDNTAQFDDKLKQGGSQFVSAKLVPIQSEGNSNKNIPQSDNLQFYENNKNEEEYDIEKANPYHEESINEDESRPMNTEYMNVQEGNMAYKQGLQNYNEDLSKDAIEMDQEEHRSPQDRRYTEPYAVNTKTGLQSSKLMTSNDIDRDIEQEIDNEIEELNLFK